MFEKKFHPTLTLYYFLHEHVLLIQVAINYFSFFLHSLSKVVNSTNSNFVYQSSLTRLPEKSAATAAPFRALALLACSPIPRPVSWWQSRSICRLSLEIDAKAALIRTICHLSFQLVGCLEF